MNESSASRSSDATASPRAAADGHHRQPRELAGRAPADRVARGRARVLIGPVSRSWSSTMPRADRSPRRSRLTVPGLRLVARPDNEGFAAGVNAGWRVARSPWLLVLNPDVEVASGFLGQVFARLDQLRSRIPTARRESSASACGTPTALPRARSGVFPTLARTIWEQFIPRSRRKYQAGWRIRSGPVDWVTGACMLVNSAMIAALGGMDEDFFLYYEEVAFSRAAQQPGLAGRI